MCRLAGPSGHCQRVRTQAQLPQPGRRAFSAARNLRKSEAPTTQSGHQRRRAKPGAFGARH
eukprot:13096004-Alexandrium_andersonii.AAC.1